jgi:hypothetical protein
VTRPVPTVECRQYDYINVIKLEEHTGLVSLAEGEAMKEISLFSESNAEGHLPGTDFKSDVEDKIANHLDIVTGHDLGMGGFGSVSLFQRRLDKRTIFSAASGVPSGKLSAAVISAVRMKH